MSKLKRKDCFFGMHFDFHADSDSKVGERVHADIFERYITEIKPDYIQVDSKGHSGLASFETKFGPQAEIKVDLLKLYREITDKYNVPLFVHHSGVWDVRYVKEHPENAVVDKDGNVSPNMASSYGPYVDEKLIPQMKELRENYKVDGVWIDGDCWAVEHDYSRWAQPHMHRLMTLNQHDALMREAFKAYLKKYVDEMHEFDPEFQITSNWAYTSYMPEAVDINLDFLSGDYPASNSVRIARYEGRCIAPKNLPWDLMTWGFTIAKNSNFYKPAIQMQQEAAVIISLGGGFQIYNNQNRDGSVNETPLFQAKKVAEFCRKRQKYNHKKTPVGQVGVYYSEYARYKNGAMFNAAGATNALIGAVGAILDAQHATEIFYNFGLEDIQRFDAVVFPEWDVITKEEKEAFIKYAENGGNLIIMGAKASKLFEEYLPVELKEYHERQRLYIRQNDMMSGFETNYYEAYGEGMKAYSWFDDESEYGIAVTKNNIGKGTITAMLFDFGTTYGEMRSSALRNCIDDILCGMYSPMVKLSQKNIDVSLQKDGEKMVVNLINMNGDHAGGDAATYDFIPQLYNVEVLVDMQDKYTKITAPLRSDKPIDFVKEGRYAKLTVDIDDIHEILILE